MRGCLVSFARDILATGLRDAAQEVVEAVLNETSWQLWAPICSDLRWSGQFRLRLPPNFGLEDTAHEVVWRVSRETSSQLWAHICPGRMRFRQFRPRHPRAQICLDLRWSTQSRLRHPPSFVWSQRCFARGGPASFASDILATLGSDMPRPEVVHPVSPETSSQLWAQRCFARSGPVSFA